MKSPLLRLVLEKRRNAITFGSQRARADQFQILDTARLLTSHSLAFVGISSFSVAQTFGNIK
jgi:hypothetical protein